MLLALIVLAAVERASIECPVDGTLVEAGILLSTNATLGHDRDLCPHAAGGVDGDEIRAGIAWCTTCGFAGTPQELERDTSEEIGARIQKELKPATTVAEAWAARAKILEWSGEPEARVGESWLRAAWSVRLDESRPDLDPALSQKLAELAKAHTPPREKLSAYEYALAPARAIDAKLGAGKLEDRALAAYLSGTIWRSRGELSHAESRLELARAEAPESLVPAIDRSLASIAVEREYLTRALARFRAALASGSKVPEKQRALLAYLAAESARRLENFEEATRYYKMAEKLGAKDPQLPPLVKQGLADSKAKDKAK